MNNNSNVTNFCTNCGHQNTNNTSFCENCGARLGNNTQSIPNNQNVMNNQNMPNNQEQLPNKKKKKKHGCLIAFLIFILIIALIIFLAIKLTSRKLKVQDIELDYNFLGISDNNEYYIQGADKDISFAVSEDATYKVFDTNGNLVDTIYDNYFVKNPNSYKEGKEYVIELTNGSFLSSQLQDTKKVKFKIKKEEVSKYSYKDNVYDSAKINISSDEKYFTSSNKYKTGDVVITSDNKSAYYIESVDNDKYYIREAELEEIFDELEYYENGGLDLSASNIAEDVKKYAVETFEKTSIYKLFMNEVLADEKLAKYNLKVTQEYDKENLTLKTTAKLTIEPNDKLDDKLLDQATSSMIAGLKNHKLTIEYELDLSIIRNVDIGFREGDISLQTTTTNKVTVKIDNEKLDFTKIFNIDKKKIQRSVFIEMKKALDQDTLKDGDGKSIKIINASFPTSIPGLTLDLELELVFDCKMTATAKASQTWQNITTIGVSYDDDGVTPYKDKVNQNDGLEVNAVGKLEIKGGLKLSFNIALFKNVKFGAYVEGGLYLEAKLEINATEEFVSSNVNPNSDLEIIYSDSTGYYLKAGLQIKVGKKYTEDFTLYDEKYKMLETPQTIIFTTKEGESEEDSTVEALEIYSTNEEGELVSSVDSVNGIDEALKEISKLSKYLGISTPNSNTYCSINNSSSTERFDFYTSNGIVTGGRLIFEVDVSSEYPKVTSLLKLIVKVATLYVDFRYKTLGTYMEEGNKAYIVIPLTKSMIKDLSNGVENPNYYSIKGYLINQNYSCS